jgi:alpha-1,3-rhamnosyl/mannosyltransferase
MGRAVYLFPNYVAWPTLMSPTIPFVYDLSFVHHAQYVHPKNREFLNDQVPRTVAKAAKVLTISEHSRGEIIAEYGLDPSRVFVCYPAVDTSRYQRRDADTVARAKARYGIHGDYILFVGNIEPRKGLLELLLAYERLDADLRAQHALLLVGAKGWLDEEITETIVRLRMAGNRILRPSDYVVDTDLPALYSGASLFAYPSHYEGFGMPPVEAMACGVPVVTADNSALPEAVGDAALMIDSHDADALAGAMTKVLRDPSLAADLVTRGHEQVARFDYGQSARVLLDEIASVA